MARFIEFRQHNASGEISLRIDKIYGFERFMSNNEHDKNTITVILVEGAIYHQVDEPYEQVKKKIEQAMEGEV